MGIPPQDSRHKDRLQRDGKVHATASSRRSWPPLKLSMKCKYHVVSTCSRPLRLGNCRPVGGNSEAAEDSNSIASIQNWCVWRVLFPSSFVIQTYMRFAILHSTLLQYVIEFCSKYATCISAASKIEFFVGLVPESKLHQRTVSFQDCKFERLGLTFKLIFVIWHSWFALTCHFYWPLWKLFLLLNQSETRNTLEAAYACISRNRCWINTCRTGHISLDENRGSGFQTRELKSVHVDAVCRYVRLVIHKNHINELNLYNQVPYCFRRSFFATINTPSCILVLVIPRFSSRIHTLSVNQ